MKYLLALHQSRALTTATLNRLIKKVGSAQQICALSPSALKTIGLTDNAANKLQRLDWHAVDQALTWVQAPQHHILTHDHPHYPVLLQQIYDPPTVLYIIGDPHVLSQRQLAIVGSRHATPIGLELAEQFAFQLAQAGYAITSGLALGVDGASHRGALRTKCGTIAVLGSGLNKIYPKRHQSLAAQIADSGAIVSELPLDAGPHASHFPQRNRIISGLSLGTLVIEAALRSGSLITARLAAEQGRNVFALPGSTQNPLARGCHALIRQGAILIEQVGDILETLGPLEIAQQQLADQNKPTPTASGLDASHQKLLECVGFAPTSTNQIVARSQLSVATVSAILLQLELTGHIQQTTIGYVRMR